MDGLPDLTFSDDDDETSARSARQAKLHQTESSFQAQKSSWKPICQTKQAARRLNYRVDRLPPESKELALEIKAAAEERYYAREYQTALALAERGLKAAEGVLHASERRELEGVRGRCVRRLAK
ncbi:unnamed protein product [Tuber melanosporum]|jgi:outer membrane murein-binding lipoprotein Lpp|uniref:(Perigord truffle) hypothetical protein n=1 Tax=Tuber melanosporum (strain Mel28) TaxID=656061 RepID=D5G430_TUBMM|nr:uncharacterized protein GSTUM_00003927001 [Tuber melanosporum]KAG0127116.1 hypothetical protein HOY82DRAFT_568494 [Tuber indicum]CAZ79273.1 unnamed protein product [Tuber melanosporum]